MLGKKRIWMDQIIWFIFIQQNPRFFFSRSHGNPRVPTSSNSHSNAATARVGSWNFENVESDPRMATCPVVLSMFLDVFGAEQFNLKLIHSYSFLDIDGFLGNFVVIVHVYNSAEVRSNGLTRSAHVGECNPREESTAAKTCWRNSKHLTGNSHIPWKIGFLHAFICFSINRSVNLCEAVYPIGWSTPLSSCRLDWHSGKIPKATSSMEKGRVTKFEIERTWCCLACWELRKPSANAVRPHLALVTLSGSQEFSLHFWFLCIFWAFMKLRRPTNLRTKRSRLNQKTSETMQSVIQIADLQVPPTVCLSGTSALAQLQPIFVEKMWAAKLQEVVERAKLLGTYFPP